MILAASANAVRARSSMTFVRSAAIQQRQGLPVEVLTPEQVASRRPWLTVYDVVGATYRPTDGYGSPHEVLQGFATWAQHHGISENTGKVLP